MVNNNIHHQSNTTMQPECTSYFPANGSVAAYDPYIYGALLKAHVWANRWVDGSNPDNPHGAAVAAFLRDETIDPYASHCEQVLNIWRVLGMADL